jgi:2,3-bisphosphoglycerate-dependent phosphoglycerate mutase
VQGIVVVQVARTDMCNVDGLMDEWIALVRHGAPSVDPKVPSDHWHLSTAGRDAVARLAVSLREMRPSVIVCSPERKARETARLIYPGHDIRIDEDLREQGLGQVPFLSAVAFSKAIKDCFEQPRAAILGRESAESAAERMHQALGRLAGLPALVVSHGRIISSYVSALIGVPGLQIWHALKMPDVLLVDPRARRVGRVGASFP